MVLIMSIGVSSSSGNDTGASTSNPQSIGQSSSLQSSSSNLQTPVNPTSIDNSSAIIPLDSIPGSSTTQPVKNISKDTHHISSAAFIPIAILVVIALGSCIYIYLMSKKPNKYA